MSYSQFSEKDKGGKSNVTGISCRANKELHGHGQLPSEGQTIVAEGQGLLSVTLSLPDDWNYNMKGLARLSKDGLDSVRSTVNELERYGYVTRHRIRTETGQLADTEYLVRERPLDQEEQPITLRTDSPGQENQLTGGANDGFPNTGDPNTIKD